MLKSDLEELKREHPDGLEVQTGACRFCGQMAQIETLFPWEQEKLNEAATELCTCGEALYYTSRKKRVEKAKKTLGLELKSYLSEESIMLLQNAVELIENEEAKSITFDGKENKVKISMTAKGGIKIEKTKVKKEVREL